MLSLFGTKHKRNKKVLLRERKRHTARGVASARMCSIPCPGGDPVPGLGGIPSLPGQGGYPRYHPPIQTWDGVPPPRPDLGWGTPPQARPGMGYPPGQTWDGVTPQPDLGWGTPFPGPGQTWDGVPPPPGQT